MRCLCVVVFQLLAASLQAAGAEQVAPGIFRIGELTVNQKERLITFPAKLNMTNGLLEYALVHKDGKVHESVLVCETKPHEIHAAMLLLGTAPTNLAENAEAGGQIEHPADIVPKGMPVEILVSWRTGGKVVRQPLAALIFNKKTKAEMEAQPWVYNGSRFSQGRFLAELSGSIVSFITDLDALVNNTSAGHNDDTIWEVNPRTVPPQGTRVDVSFRIPVAKKH